LDSLRPPHHQALSALMKPKLTLFVIFILALSIRLYGINWDSGFHLHPDERFLTMVGSDIKLPNSLGQYFDTFTSPLNPHNYPNYQFFVYGTFPLFLTKFISSIFHLDNYSYIHLFGRALSALFDASNIFLLYFLSKKRFLAPLLYSFLVLPIQLSHFFAVDTFLTFFVVLTFTLLVHNQPIWAGFTLGLGLASKISALYFAPIILLFFIYHSRRYGFFKSFCRYLIFSLLVFISFRIFQPYAFTGLITPNPQFINNLKTLSSYSNPNTYFPPAVQWLSKTPLIFSLQNIIIFGFGPLLLVFLLKKSVYNFHLFLASFWVLLLYFYQGSQFAHTMRYFLPIYPFLALIISQSLKQRPNLIILQMIIALGFISIYSRPHSRIQASNWIYHNITKNKIVSYEYWDDPLPLNLDLYNSNTYGSERLSLYDQDSTQKWQLLNQQLSNIDYLIMSSNRLWGSIPMVPNRYPETTAFYQNLFDEKLEFKKLIEFNSYPGFYLPFLKNCYYFGPTNFPYKTKTNHWFSVDASCNYPGLYLRDDIAEEAFTVYDHPKVLIFQKKYE
jgi:hypothetical protein